ncbi:unnamed protein product [marine sediment metagenome]|uniref:Uncharacterized protein n=1 Tax=marine sediment metagenome TaxID=412755 RepID=X0VP14_9ZZZZ
MSGFMDTLQTRAPDVPAVPEPAPGRVQGNVNGAYVNLSVSGGKEAVMKVLTLSESSIIDALLLRLPMNLFAF